MSKGLLPLTESPGAGGTACFTYGMTEQISWRELSIDSDRIRRALAKGRSFVVTTNDQPVGELHPLRRTRFAHTAAVVELFRSAPAVDTAAFRRDVDHSADSESQPRA